MFTISLHTLKYDAIIDLKGKSQAERIHETSNKTEKRV